MKMFAQPLKPRTRNASPPLPRFDTFVTQHSPDHKRTILVRIEQIVSGQKHLFIRRRTISGFVRFGLGTLGHQKMIS